jgi:hypothetical protein
MTAASKTVFYFGYYLIILGLVLILMPNLLLLLFGLEETKEVWLRVAGVLVFNKALYYIYASQTNSPKFLMATIVSRLLVMFWFLVFILAGWANVKLILFGCIDVGGALWTWVVMKRNSA